MYYTNKDGGISSYISGVNYSYETQKALQNRSEENKRLSTTASQDESFEKQKAIQEAIQQLKMTGSVSADIAQKVNVEELKKSLEESINTNKESDAAKMLSNTSGSKKSNKAEQTPEGSQEVLSQTEALKQEAYKKLANLTYQNAPEKDIENTRLQIRKLEAKEKAENEDELISMSDKKDSFFEKEIIKSPSNAPKNISDEIKNGYNPLESNGTTKPNSVSFIDEVSGKNISVPLTEENAKAIKEKFGSLDSKEAQDFVKSWYYDAAYSMGYLEQDKDGDGKLSLDEGIHINSLVSLKDSKYYSVADRIPGGVEAQKQFLEKFGFFDNIGDFINHSISQDKDLNGTLNLKEMMGDKEELMLFKTSGAEGNTLDIYVLKHYKVDIENNIDDILINLGNNKEQNTNQDQSTSSKDEKIKVTTSDDYNDWIKDLKKLVNENYLNNLNTQDKENLLKSETILQNLLKDKISA